MKHLKRETPCTRCGWVYKGDHFCYDKSTPEPGVKLVRPPSRDFNGGTRNLGGFTDEAREKAAESNQARWAEYRAATAVRDERIVELYNDNVSMQQIGIKLSCNKTTVRKILVEAALRGETTIRARGYNIGKQADLESADQY